MKSIELSSAAPVGRISPVSSLALPRSATIHSGLHPDDVGSACALSFFEDVPLSRRIELLIEFAARRHSVDTHWPLPGLVFNEISRLQNVNNLDMDAILSAIIGAYRIRLAPWHRADMREHSFGTGLEVLERCAKDWQMRVLEHTAGQLELSNDAVRLELARWSGSTGAPAFSLALDFRKRPEFVGGDSLSNTANDSVGACYNDAKPYPRVVLFVRRIQQDALEAVSPGGLKDCCMRALVQVAVRLQKNGSGKLVFADFKKDQISARTKFDCPQRSGN